MTYCDVNDVGALLGVTIGETSTPTTTQVQAFINYINAEIVMMLNVCRIPAPAMDDPLFKVLKGKCAIGAAGIAAHTLLAGAEDVSKTLGAKYNSMYDAFIKDFLKDPNKYCILDNGILIDNQVTDGSYNEDDIPYMDNDWTP